MATATKAPKLFTVLHEITGDADCDEEPFNVYSPDGEFEACFSDEAAARAHVVECNESLEDEREAEEQAERDELIDALQAHVEDMDLKALRKLAKRWEVI